MYILSGFDSLMYVSCSISWPGLATVESIMARFHEVFAPTPRTKAQSYSALSTFNFPSVIILIEDPNAKLFSRLENTASKLGAEFFK
jgi:ABC-type spermidine/putrescine transport system permease subunit II